MFTDWIVKLVSDISRCSNIFSYNKKLKYSLSLWMARPVEAMFRAL